MKNVNKDLDRNLFFPLLIAVELDDPEAPENTSCQGCRTLDLVSSSTGEQSTLMATRSSKSL